MAVLFADKRKPGSPTDLVVGTEMDHGDGYLNVKWRPPSDTAVPVKGYTVWLDRHRLGELGGILEKPISGFELRIPIGRDLGRDYHLEDRAVGENGVAGAPATAKVRVSAGTVPDVQLRRYYESDDGSTLKWVWNYPDGIPELAGFRVLIDGNVFADEGVLRADTREL